MPTKPFVVFLMLLAACVAATSSAENDSQSDDTGNIDTGADDTGEIEGALDVSTVRMTECDRDTGDRYCNGERRGLRAEDLGGGTVGVSHTNLYISCGSVSASARATGQTIEVTYRVSDGADCSCQHLLEYEIFGVEEGLWTIEAWDQDAEVEVAPAE